MGVAAGGVALAVLVGLAGFAALASGALAVAVGVRLAAAFLRVPVDEARAGDAGVELTTVSGSISEGTRSAEAFWRKASGESSAARLVGAGGRGMVQKASLARNSGELQKSKKPPRKPKRLSNLECALQKSMALTHYAHSM
jgi:hypothetical protein